MLIELQKIEKILPKLLQENDWNSLYVDYHKPYVNRLWRQFGDYRLCLHLIEPCMAEEALFHPHPWPSAMKIISNKYEMGYGFSPDGSTPEVTSKFILTENSYYEMLTSKDWHYVRPIDESAYSIMLSGKPFVKSEPTKPELKSLNEEKKLDILEFFRKIYK